MKKILRNIFLCILALIVIAAGGVWYTLFGVSEKPVEVDPSNVTSTTDYTGPYVDVSVDPNQYAGEIVTTISSNVTTTKKPDSANDSTSNSADKNTATTAPAADSTTSQAQTGEDPYRLEAFRIKQYHDIIASGTFLMETTMKDEELGDTPVTMALKNGNTYVETSMSTEGITLDAKVIYIGSTQTTYLVIDNWKKYTKVPADLLGDADSLDMAGALQESYAEEDISNIKVSEVELGGKKLILESYNNGGTTVNYYFDGDVLVRRDDVASDGTVSTTIFSKFTTNVPDSYFEIPKGYGYLNLDWLESLGAFE